jgi:signal transduction histidine kinase
MLERALPESMVELHDQARRAGERLSELTNDIQTLSHRLHSSKLDYLGIAAAASSFCKKFSEQQKVEINFSDGGYRAACPRSAAAAPRFMLAYRSRQRSMT